MKFEKKLLIGLVIVVVFTPLGILIPMVFNAGGAWGEWDTETLGKLVGYIPEGVKKYTGIWKAPIPDYNFGGENASVMVQIISYIAAGIIGIVLVSLIIYIMTKFLIKNEK